MSYRSYKQATKSRVAASQNFVRRPCVHSKASLLRVILASRVSSIETGPTVRTRDIKVFRRVA